ncbi:hypothetical protein BC938DRAFT_480862 [Jimgerdemannia flammicorona]|uniref:Uncharacterized protein n=1 Tax=Jimgerdemannia flammicorona TaxID=994334 RepID=A0A433QHI5_9FUNG|nr:hypothetical protein BC938DRAFT_480862 [Jimgerdemannia flammicorona]
MQGYLYHTFNEFWTSHEQPDLTVMDFEEKFRQFKVLVEQELLARQVLTLREMIELEETKGAGRMSGKMKAGSYPEVTLY